MIGQTRLEVLRFSTLLGAIVMLVLVLAACSSAVDRTVTGSIDFKAQYLRGDVEMMSMPGDGRKVPMPPAWMRKQIEQRMNSGRVPGYVEVSASKLQQKCRAHDQLLGCVVNFNGLKVIYVRTQLTADVRHMVLVHEYAHDLYDWVH
jgi:hypothetical protein